MKLVAFQREAALQLLADAENDSDGNSTANTSAASAVASEKDSCDGLAILAPGLGCSTLLRALVRIYAVPESLVLLLGLTADDELALMNAEGIKAGAGEQSSDAFKGKEGVGDVEKKDEKENDKQPLLVRSVDAETPAAERAALYLGGGVLAVTPRILIVDMLNNRVPLHLVTGILVYNAHRVIETSTEAFILRVYRQHNKVGFIKALSEFPENFLGGFAKVEKIMKNLFVRKLHLWPRFHVSVAATIEKRPCDVIELKVPLTERMNEIQNAVMDVISICLQELKKSNAEMDLAEFTVENALMKSFDNIMQDTLDPMMHRLSNKSKQLVGDLKILRKLLK